MTSWPAGKGLRCTREATLRQHEPTPAAKQVPRGSMIGHCFNPDCNEELRYLRKGTVYQLETGLGGSSIPSSSGYVRFALPTSR